MKKNAKIYVGRSMHDRAQSIALRSYTLHELRDRKRFFLVSSSDTTEEDTHFVLCTVKAKKQKTQLLTNGCHGNFKVDEDKALTSKCFQVNFVNFTKFGGYSLIVMSGSLQS